MHAPMSALYKPRSPISNTDIIVVADVGYLPRNSRPQLGIGHFGLVLVYTYLYKPSLPIIYRYFSVIANSVDP